MKLCRTLPVVFGLAAVACSSTNQAGGENPSTGQGGSSVTPELGGASAGTGILEDGTPPDDGCPGAYQAEIELAIGADALRGTVSIPKGCGRFPVIVIHPDLGSVDRDGNDGSSLHTDAYKLFAEALAAQGLASVRYDKRGVGASGGLPPDPSALRFESNLADLVAWVDFLREDERFEHVIVAGHGEGALLAMLAAGQSEVSGYISLEGAARPYGDLLRYQFKLEFSGATLNKLNEIIDALEQGEPVELEEDLPSFAKELFAEANQSYLTSLFQYDPASDCIELSVPGLVIQGAQDLELPQNEGALLAGFSDKATYKLIPEMNYVLKQTAAKTFGGQERTYTQPDFPIAAGLAEAVREFVGEMRQ